MEQSLLEKLEVTQPNSLSFMGPKGSLPCSQKPDIAPYSEPDEFSTHTHTLFL